MILLHVIIHFDIISEIVLRMSSALSCEISYYLNVVIDINKKVGGKRGYGTCLVHS